MAMTPRLWNLHELSVELGVSRTKLIRIMADLPPKQKAGKKKGHSDRWLLSEVVDRMLSTDGGDAPAYSLAREEARYKKGAADMKELQVAALRQKLLDADDVMGAIVEIFMAVRSKLLGIPKRGAPLILGIKKPTEGQKVLESMVEDSLKELAGLGEKQFKSRLKISKAGPEDEPED